MINRVFNTRQLPWILLGVLVSVGSGSIAPAYAQAGRAGLSFLKLGTSARGIAMGDAMAASVQGPASVSYNPAGLVTDDTSSAAELLFTHREWIEETRIEFLAGSAHLSDNQVIGLAITSTTVPDIQLRTRPGEPEGTFTARNFAAVGSYARAFTEELAIGIALKFLYEKILIDEASGFAVDLGARIATPIEHLNVGASLANLGSMSSLRNEATTLPALFRLGPAYSFDLSNERAVVLTAVDLLYLFPEKRTYLNWGGEVEFDRTVAVRGGYQFGSEGRGLTAGMGLRYGIVRLDYAYAKLSQDLGNTHSFTLGLTL
jgi:hypothetical protein